jgi:RNA-binding protein
MISDQQRKYLRRLGQTLPTKFQLGKDKVHPDFIKLIDQALTRHELIKIHFLKSMQDEKDSILPKLLEQLKADLIQTIGHRVILFRRNPLMPRIILPK